MKKFLIVIDVIICVLVFLSVASYFGKKSILENMDDHFAYNTKYWGPTDAPDASVEVDPDVAFTFVVNY